MNAHRQAGDAQTPGLFKWLRERLGIWCANSQYDYFAAIETHTRAGSDWLDVGCGHQFFPSWLTWDPQRRDALTERFRRRVGLDLDFADLVRNRELDHKTFASVEQLPFADASFDLITANMVVEHVADPAAALAEVRRCLRPGGLLIFHTPNLLYPTMAANHLASFLLPQQLKARLAGAIEGRAEQDVFPTRYRLNTPRRVRRLARSAGFEIVQLDTVESIPSSMRSFALIGAAELLFMWLVRKLRLTSLRSNLVIALRKPAAPR